MFPPTKPRKPDRLDDFPKGSLLHEEIKAEFQRIRILVREITDKGGAVVLGVDIPRPTAADPEAVRFDYRLPAEAQWYGCDVKDLHGVLRRMAKSRELMYETYEWTWEPMKGQVWKWYVKREDWDEKKRDRRTSRAGDDNDKSRGAAGVGYGVEWDGGDTSATDIDDLFD